MKYYWIVLVVLISSCKNQPEPTVESQTSAEKITKSGVELFEDNNCTACHKPDQKIVGPSLQDIAKIYKAQNGNMVAFLKEEADPIVDPTMYETMKINLQVTKTMSDEELKALEEYILGFAK